MKAGCLTIVAIDDDPVDLRLLSRNLEKIADFDTDVVSCRDWESARVEFQRLEVDVVLMDQLLGADRGVELIPKIRGAGVECPIILLTGQGSEEVVIEAMRAGAADYLSKSSLSPVSLRRSISNALEKHDLSLSVAQKTQQLEESNAQLEVQIEQRNQLLADLRKANQVKDDFIANVSHELRTPLATISIVFSNAIEGVWGSCASELRQGLTIGKTNCERLADHISNLLDISKFDSGKLYLENSLVDVSTSIRSVVQSFTIKASEKEISLVCSGDNQPEIVFCDSSKLTQIVINLIGNALKFTPPGGKVSISLASSQSEVQISVADTGKGIPEESRALIFDRFWQSGRNKGTGLGLAISKELVELHQGRIWVETEEDKGSVFHFTLPRYDCLARLGRTVDRVFRGCAKTGQPFSAVVLPVSDPRGIAEQILLSIPERNFELSLQSALGKMAILFPGASKKDGHELKGRIVEAAKPSQRLSSSLLSLASYPEDAKDTNSFVALLENLLKENVHEASIT